METFCEGTCVSGEFAVTYGRITQINDKRKDVSHDMIKVDISNVWGQVTLSDLLAMEKEVAAAHTTLADGTGAGNDFLGWQNLPVREATEEITRIQRAAEKIRSESRRRDAILKARWSSPPPRPQTPVPPWNGTVHFHK